MKIKISVGIYGQPIKLNLRADILYGNKNQYRTHVFKKEFSLDKGGEIELPMNFFEKWTDENIDLKYQNAD